MLALHGSDSSLARYSPFRRVLDIEFAGGETRRDDPGHPGGGPGNDLTEDLEEARLNPRRVVRSAASRSAEVLFCGDSVHQMAAKKTTGAYSARDLAVLEGLDAVRKRPGMYIGSNDGRGLMHCLWEIFDNSVDEALAGHCTRSEVVLEAGGSVLVSDNGRGIPVDKEPKTKLSGVELVMTKLHAGGKFGGGSYTASGGLHGVGASVVNALSSRLDVEVDRSGKTHGMSFRRGVPGIFEGNGPDGEFQRAKGLNIVGKAPRHQRAQPATGAAQRRLRSDAGTYEKGGPWW